MLLKAVYVTQKLAGLGMGQTNITIGVLMVGEHDPAIRFLPNPNSITPIGGEYNIQLWVCHKF